jgi:UDP-glucose 4-epimerase
MATGQIFNIAGGSRVSLHEVIQLLQEITGTPINTTFTAKQHGDVRDTFADTERARQIIGYHPLVSLREGLAKEFADITSLYGTLYRNARYGQVTPV